MRYLALLRGINVGGKAKLPMKELASIFGEAGAAAVRTYIQSGNVIFEAAGEVETASIATRVTAAIAERYGYPGRIVLRSTDEMQAALAGNPFARAGADAEALHVYFLAEKPETTAVKGLDPERSPGDSFAVWGREVYLHLPGGMARTKLTNAYFDGRLKTVSTARNWRTVGVLAGMMH
jgi:uncharacterized protein (DUF1697 family)